MNYEEVTNEIITEKLVHRKKSIDEAVRLKVLMQDASKRFWKIAEEKPLKISLDMSDIKDIMMSVSLDEFKPAGGQIIIEESRKSGKYQYYLHYNK